MTDEQELAEHKRTGRLTTKQRVFLESVSCADCDEDVWKEFGGRCPEASHDDFAELWGWASRMHYCMVDRPVKSYHVTMKGAKKLQADRETFGERP